MVINNIQKIILISFIFNACSNIGDRFSADIQKKYDKGLELYNVGKYTRAREQFEFIVMNNPGSKLSIDAQFYLAESMFENKNYIEANSAYSKYIRWSTDPVRIENSRYKIANCAVNSVNEYQKDLAEAKIALSLLQDFIDDYPYSDFINHSEELVKQLRNKLARKEYETAKLYLKLEKFESAEIYFNTVINDFYDTQLFEQSHLGIMLGYLLNKEQKKLEEYYEKNINVIKKEYNIEIAKKIKNNELSSLELFNQIYR
tara:strand:+ start:95 stop:871 length:777 start_codon:yes stop_codon:yes gene_type:complete